MNYDSAASILEHARIKHHSTVQIMPTLAPQGVKGQSVRRAEPHLPKQLNTEI